MPSAPNGTCKFVTFSAAANSLWTDFVCVTAQPCDMIGWQRGPETTLPTQATSNTWHALHVRRGMYDSFVPTVHPKLSSVGHLRIRIGGMAEPPVQRREEAYIVLSVNGQTAPPSRPLPREHSALLPQNAWQTFSIPLDVRTAINTTLRMEVVSWAPGTSERSAGATFVDVEHVVRDGRLELLAPFGIEVEMVWMAPTNALRQHGVEVLPGSGVRFAVGPGDELTYETARESIWTDGYAPSPSAVVSVGGLPPSTPPRWGYKWEWGNNSWHEVEEATVRQEALKAEPGHQWVYGVDDWHEIKRR